jgi:general secretion pathway protein G
MSHWYYYNADAEKIGPITPSTLKQLAQQGVVTRKTVIENINGRSTLAGQVNGLSFPEVSSTDNPFTTPLTESNPFSAPQSVSGSVVKKNKFSAPIIAIAVVGVISLMLWVVVSLVLPKGIAGRNVDNANDKVATFINTTMKGPLEQFKFDHGRYPTTMEGFGVLIKPPDGLDASKGNWPYISDSVKWYDPWGSPYQYLSPGRRNPGSYDLWSMGADKMSDTGDDIGNWLGFNVSSTISGESPAPGGLNIHGGGRREPPPPSFE